MTEKPKRVVCFTGGRDRTDAAAREIVERELMSLDGDGTVFVGDCPTGVDRMVTDWLSTVGLFGSLQCTVMLAGEPGDHLQGFSTLQASNWKTDGKSAGPRRNEVMLGFLSYRRNVGDSVRVVAIPGEGPGTRGAIAIAEQLELDVTVHESPTHAPRWPTEIQQLIDQHFMLSASSYKLAKRCIRRWAFKEIGKQKEPATTATEFGSRAHEQAENFLRDGIAPDIHTTEGKLVYESLPHLPRPGEAMIEVPFAFELDGAWFYGRIDGVLEHESVRTHNGQTTTIPGSLKFDHKFVGSLDYVETPESLPLDPAAVLYTLAPPVFETTRLRWIYNLKKRKKGQDPSNPVDAQLHVIDALKHAQTHLVPAWRLLSGIRDIFAGQSPADALPLLNAVPCNPQDCMAFNRPCPNMSHCSRENPGSLEELIHGQ